MIMSSVHSLPTLPIPNAVSVKQLRQQFSKHIQSVEEGQRLTVERNGKPVAVVISLEDYQTLSQMDERQRLDQMYDALQELAQDAVSIEGAEDTSTTIDEYLYGDKADNYTPEVNE